MAEPEALTDVDSRTDHILGKLEDGKSGPAEKAAFTEADTPHAGENDGPSDAEVDKVLDKEAKTESAPKGADAAPAEKQPSGGDKAAVEPAKEPPIDPPASWADEWKEKFKTLPREQQTMIAERERERDSDIRRRQNEVADQRKAAESAKAAYDAETQRLAQERQAELQRLNTVIDTVIATNPMLAKAGDQNYWVELAKTDPARYTAEKAELDRLLGQVQQTMMTRDQLAQQGQRDILNGRQTFLGEQNKLLLDKIPEWKDEKIALPQFREVLDYARNTYGVSEQEVHNVGDHRLVLLFKSDMAKSQKIAQLEKDLAATKTRTEDARKAAEAKRVNPVPRVAAPQAQNEASEPSQRSRDLKNRARRTGKQSDQINAVMAVLNE